MTQVVRFTWGWKCWITSEQKHPPSPKQNLCVQMALKRKNTLPLLLLEDAPSKNKPWELVQVSTATWIGRCVLGLKHDWLIKRHWWRHIGAASQVLSKTALSVHLFPPLLSVSLVSFYEFMKHLSLSRSLEMKMRYQVPSLQLQEGCGIGNCWKGCLCLHL